MINKQENYSYDEYLIKKLEKEIENSLKEKSEKDDEKNLRRIKDEMSIL